MYALHVTFTMVTYRSTTFRTDQVVRAPFLEKGCEREHFPSKIPNC